MTSTTTPLSNYKKNMSEASPLEVELAIILRELLFQDQPNLLRSIALEPPPPLFIQQARTLADNHILRGKIKMILESNSFSRGVS